jgi:putative DNA primase/helicase
MSTTARTTADRIARYLRWLHESGDVIELRILNVVDNPRYGAFTLSGYFDHGHLDELAKIAMEWTDRAEGVYCTVNPVRPDLLARAANRVVRKPKHTTGDAEIVRRIGLVFDADPRRPAGVSATDAEKAAAHERILQVKDELTRRGWPALIVADSGNGYHLRYKIDLPADDGGLIERVLKAADALWSDERVAIDTSLFNPARIIKLYGTIARKGDHTDDRPHRQSRVISAPKDFHVVPRELLEALAAEHQPAGPQTQANGPPRAGPAKATARGGVGTLPGDDFEARASWAEILEPHGWRIDRTIGEETRWTRPGKGAGTSATTGHNAGLHVFTSSAPPFEPGGNYNKFHVYTLLNYNGDFGAAAKALAEQGYGSRPQRRSQPAAPAPAAPKPPTFEGQPRPISVDLLPVPALDPHMIPAPFRGWLADIAERGCFPIEYATAAAIVGVSGLIGRRLAIRPKRQDHWLVPPNLWGAIVGPPGIQKSPPVEEALRPLRRLVADARDRHAQAMDDWTARQLANAAKKGAAKEALKEAAKKKVGDDRLTEMARAALVDDKEDQPRERRYMVNDVTIEKLGELMAENPSGLTWFRDELIGMLRTLDRQGHESDRAFLLESWSGLSSFTFDRIGRGKVYIPSCCLALFGTIQPGPLARYLRGSFSGEECDGFIPRFQVMLYPDPPAVFVNVDRYPETDAKNKAYAVFQALDQLDPAALSCDVDEDHGIPFLRFAEDAQDFFDGWRVELENRLRSGTLSSIMAVHLAKYRSLLPSLALEFHLIASCPRAEADGSLRWARLDPVSLQAAMMAAAWCELLESHARRIYQSAMDGDIDAAVTLGERIRASLPNPFAYWQVVKKGWSGLSTTEEVRRAVGILEDRGWVKVVEIPPTLAGGRPGDQVWIHPDLLAEKGVDG